MNNYVGKGETITVTAPYAVASGAGVLVAGTGHLFGIAVNTQASGDNMEILTTGIFDLVKDASTFANGDYVYWDNTAKKATSTSAGNTKIGTAALLLPVTGGNALGGATGDATVRVRLNQTF
jgi:predicted RecA/RadA family phage recombinase